MKINSMKSASEVRTACRKGRWDGPTCGLAPGFVQANLAVFPKDWAYDFLLFAQRNPRPVPVLEVGEAGDFLVKELAEDADIRTDLPKYIVWENGKPVCEVPDIVDFWREDLVWFLIGCSFSFEEELMNAGLPVRHIEEKVNVPMYRSSLICRGAGKIPDTPMVVSMRPYTPEDAERASEITGRMPSVHGAPVHKGSPDAIGIKDIQKPDFGDAVTVYPGEIPVFWACGVTPQSAVMEAKPPFMISHAPGHMFIGDKRNEEYRI